MAGLSNFKIKIYADGADLNEMANEYHRGIVSGFTTNPTLMKKAGIKDYKKFAKEAIGLIPDLPISFEVFSDDFKTMEKEARIISQWGDNVYIKIPITDTNGISSTPLIEKLSSSGIKINITAILTYEQIKHTFNVLSGKTPAIISVFAGRIADTGRNPVEIMRNASQMIKQKPNIELLWASSRELYNLIQAEECGCHIITISPDILKKLSLIGKNLDELSLETVKMFYDDAQSSGYRV
jgi:transaldolase